MTYVLCVFLSYGFGYGLRPKAKVFHGRTFGYGQRWKLRLRSNTAIMWWIIFILILKAVEHLFKFDFKKAVIPIFGNSYGDQSAVFVGSGLAVGSKSCLAAISIKIPFEKRVIPFLIKIEIRLHKCFGLSVCAHNSSEKTRSTANHVEHPVKMKNVIS